LESKRIKLQIWDTAGQERFRTITKTYYKGAHGIILTFDVTDENSFKNIRNWVKQIEQNAQNNVCKVLVGNKCDREDRKVSFEEGSKLAGEFNMKYFETSAKTNLNVNETFITLTKEILNISDNKKSQSGTVEIKKQIDNGKSEKKQCCK
jgi:Ras-related protein Rab-8A